TRGVVALVGARHYGAPSDRTTPLWCSCRASPPAGGAGKPLLAFGVLLNNTAALDLDEPDESWGEGHAHSRPPWTVRAHHRHRAGVTSVRWPVRPPLSYCGWHGSAAWIPPMGTAGRSPARREIGRAHV